jgi:hypothetical protein
MKDAFAPDGALRDIYVLDTDTADWEKLCEVLKSSNFKLSYGRDGQPSPLPDSFGKLVAGPNSNASFLRVNLSDELTIDCHSFESKTIEFSLDPSEVRGQPQFSQLLKFISDLGRALNKKVSSTPENIPDLPLLTFDPTRRSWQRGSHPTESACFLRC